MMTFAIGEKVVYPNQGVATIENISSRAFGSGLERFYLLRLLYNSMTVMVPFSNVTTIGLRKVTKTGDVNKVLNFLSHGHAPLTADWKVRFKENTDKMQSGCLLEIASILKSLTALQMEKPLSFREKKMLDRARLMLVGEVAIARSLVNVDAAGLLDKALQKAGLSLPPAL